MSTNFLIIELSIPDCDDEGIYIEAGDIHAETPLNLTEALKNPTFRKELMARGWTNIQHEPPAETELGPRLFAISRYSNSTSCYTQVIDVDNIQASFANNYEFIVAAEVGPVYLERHLPALAKQMAKQRASVVRHEKSLNKIRKTQEEKYAAAKKRREEKKLEKARQLLESAGLKIKEE